MSSRGLAFSVLGTVFMLLQVSVAQTDNPRGAWTAAFKDSLGSGTARLVLTIGDDGAISGTYSTDLGGAGSVAMRPDGKGYKFVITQTIASCTGSFVGQLTLAGSRGEGSYSGNDCKGWHDNGVIVMTREEDSAKIATSSSPAIKELPPGTELKEPARIPKSSAVNAKASLPGDYPLSIRVLQTDQVPYSVQYGGGGVSTNCSITGSTYAYGSATTVGDYTYGNATSNTDLGMHCNSYENPPMQWRHVLNTMLVVASNGNAYIIACDAAWRWSKCTALVTGDTFRAKMTSKGLAVEYFVKNKPKETTYAIMQGKVLAK